MIHSGKVLGKIKQLILNKIKWKDMWKLMCFTEELWCCRCTFLLIKLKAGRHHGHPPKDLFGSPRDPLEPVIWSDSMHILARSVINSVLGFFCFAFSSIFPYQSKLWTIIEWHNKWPMQLFCHLVVVVIIVHFSSLFRT